MPKSQEISPIAKQDLLDIFVYTSENWGLKKAEKYIENMYVRFEWLTVNPNLGIKRTDVKEGYRCYFEGSHSIFYLIIDNSIKIIGVLHQNEDVKRRFDNI